MDIINAGISVKNDDNGSSSNVNSPKSNGTNLTGDKNRIVKDISMDISKNKK